jgi:hypothetical protein
MYTNYIEVHEKDDIIASLSYYLLLYYELLRRDLFIGISFIGILFHCL